MKKEDYKDKLNEMSSEIEFFEEQIKLLKVEQDALTKEMIESELKEKDTIEKLEKDILDYDTERHSTFIAKAIDSLGIKVFAAINDVNFEDETILKKYIDELLSTLLHANIDEGYIASLETAKKCSHIIFGLSTFTMVVIVKEKTYAFAEGKSNIYTTYYGKIEKFELKNKYSELNYEVLNNDDYNKLILLSKTDMQDFSDDKIKIITKQTDREELARELI